MKQFGAIFKFEFLTIIKNKVYIAVTIVLVLLLAAVLSFSRISSVLDEITLDNPDDIVSELPDDSQDPSVYLDTIAIKNDSAINNQVLLNGFSELFEGDKVIVTDKNMAEIMKAIENEEFASAIYIKTEKSYSYIVNDITIYDSTTNMIDELLKNMLIYSTLSENGMTDNEIDSLLNVEVDSEVVAIRVNQADNYFYTYALLIILFMAIIMYGTLVATSVATEKSTRTMEILITSAKPQNLIFGKVLGAGIAGLMQFLIIILTTFVFFRINVSYFDEDSLVSLIFNMPPKTMIFAIVFFVGGYFMYAFLYGAFASLVSRSEDVNMVAMPLQMIITIAYVLVMVGVISGNTNSIMMRVLSYIPLTSPMAMFVRISMGGPSAIEIIISIVVLVLGIVFTGYLSAGMYRLGVLMYGKSPKPNEIFKIMKQSIREKV